LGYCALCHTDYWGTVRCVTLTIGVLCAGPDGTDSPSSVFVTSHFVLPFTVMK